ncbi:hypothetical protein BVX99_00140 [bacterium F16]|nr:hypothetical protein BVX99_00140 [bacterium F16]
MKDKPIAWAPWVAGFWTILVGILLLLTLHSGYKNILNVVEAEARALDLKDISYRIWNANHGGVYVPVTAEVQPNPYLETPRKTIVTTDGDTFTLINPAYMTRLTFELSQKTYGVIGHITSINPINPDNKPDEWERKTLEHFATFHDKQNLDDIGSSELIETEDGKQFRYMAPLYTEDGCLKCHAKQGYKVGEVRGGISITIPMKMRLDAWQKNIALLSCAHAGLWVIGLLGIGLSNQKYRNYLSSQDALERQLRHERDQMTTTIMSIGEGIIVTDASGNIITMNPHAEQKLGKTSSDLQGRSIESCYLLGKKETAWSNQHPVISMLKAATHARMQRRTILGADGNDMEVMDSISIIRGEAGISGAVVVFRDITNDLKKAKEQERSSRLEAIGTLAGGIAHDFNNLLMAMQCNIEIAQDDLSADSIIHETLGRSLKACDRAKDLTRQLLTFSKGGAPIRKVCSIKECLQETTSFILRGTDIAYEFDIDDDLKSVNVDLGQLSQVIQNIVMNARQSMPNSGTLHLRAKNLNESNLVTDGGNGLVEIAVKDEGQGMSDETLSQIFDPYYTTKSQGSGLGMAIAYSMIRNHDGQVTISSRENEGTDVRIVLPAAIENELTDKYAETPKLGLEGTLALVLEDDEMVLDATIKMLEKMGCRVFPVSTGDEAITIYEKCLGSEIKVDFILADLTIRGGMGGKEAMAAIRAADENAVGILVSGFSDDDVMTSFESFGFRACLTKPYSKAELESAIINAFKHT